MNARWKLNVLTTMPLRGHPGLALRRVPTSAQWVLAIHWAAEVKTPFLTWTFVGLGVALMYGS